jgi:hypothetical protein
MTLVMWNELAKDLNEQLWRYEEGKYSRKGTEVQMS